MKKTLYCIQETYKYLIFSIHCVLIIQSLYSQTANTPNYREIFGGQYTEAVNYLSQEWITDSLGQQTVNPCFAKSIVFPELIRYSSFKDKLETHGLFTLYIQYGKTYADFSIGHFQMKPSFAELIEKDISALYPEEKEFHNLDTTNNSKARLARILRLNDPAWQVKYLVWFIKVVEKKFSDIQWKTPADKLIFFATAYNCGYNRSYEYIHKINQSNYYHTSLFKSSTSYNYADISLSYWKICFNP